MSEKMGLNTELGPNVTAIGGGTGNSILIGELKFAYPDISAIVNMCDDGSSTGYYRKLGASAVGDIRQCLSALCPPENAVMAALNEFREEDGNVYGNRTLYHLEQQLGSLELAIIKTREMLGIKRGSVYPVTDSKPKLIVTDGSEIYEGESSVGDAEFKTARPEVSLKPDSYINDRAQKSISKSSHLIIAMGNPYRSLYPTLVVEGVKETIQEANPHIIVVANLLNQRNQTDGWHVMDYVEEIEKHIGKGSVGSVIYNTDLPDPAYLKKIKEIHREPVDISSERFGEAKIQQIGSAILSRTDYKKVNNDILFKGSRSRIKHDAVATAGRILEIIEEN